jgi:hypothetical protein
VSSELLIVTTHMFPLVMLDPRGYVRVTGEECKTIVRHMSGSEDFKLTLRALPSDANYD